MNVRRISKLSVSLFVAALTIALPVLADEIKGKIKSIDQAKSEIVVADEKSEKDITVSLAALNKGPHANDSLKDLREGNRVTVDDSRRGNQDHGGRGKKVEEGHGKTIFQEFWHNFTHNLFKPLLLFFYLGFLVPILKVEFEFPYVIYQGLTIYLLAGDWLAWWRRAGKT